MEITEVRIKLMESAEDRLRGFCSVTFDDSFVVRDLKIIEGNNGPFVAMPSRKLTSNCYKCRSKNHLRANYCNNCGNRLKSDNIEHDSGGRAKLYADIAHPVNAACREMIQNRVIEELNKEFELSEQPGYQSRYDDDYFERPSKHGSPKTEKPKSPPANPKQATSAAEPKSEPETIETPKSERVDLAAEKPPSPHSPNPDVSSGRSKPSADQFGKGVFD